MFTEKPTILAPANFDAVVVGGGPAGASCALWLKLLGFRPSIVERRSRLGGLQIESPYRNDWIAPLPGVTGQQVAENIHRNIMAHDIPCFLKAEVKSLRKGQREFFMRIESAEGVRQLSARHVVLASGVRPRDGGFRAVPKVLIGPGTKIANTDFSGKTVAVLGGGDNAFENFQFIRQRGAAEVHIYARTIRARREFVDKVQKPHVTVGSYSVDTERMTVSGRAYDFIVVLYGWVPNVGFAGALDLKLDSRGFIATDPQTAETSLTDLFAIGEVAQRMHPCCVTSMADGVVAAKEIQYRLEAAGRSASNKSELVA